MIYKLNLMFVIPYVYFCTVLRLQLQWIDLDYINSGNAAYIDSLYEAYKQDPESVDFGWQKFFEGFDFGKDN
jgi:hypothetical protein